MKLKLGEGLALPLDAATETFAILGRRGSGKTHTAVVMAEEMIAAGVPVVVLDPLDVWWGLRVSKDGKKAGIPIYVAGGSHEDIPLSADAGKVLADAIVDKGLSMVLSLRHLSKTDQRRFVGEFCERLYDRKADPKHRTALHVFIDEADSFVPQRLMPGSERCFGAVDTLVRRGRSSGLAPTLISQRPQVINKDVLSQTEVLVSHQLTGPQDRKALETWIEANDTANRRAEFMGSLASLPKGTAWFWSPGLLDIFKPVAVRDRHTFDSSATPKPGVATAKPTAFAAVDLEALTAEIAATIEKAKADDPRELRKQIAELRKELSSTRISLPTERKALSTPVLTDADRALLAKTATMLEQMAGHIGEKSETLILKLKDRLAEFTRDLHEDAEAIHQRARLDFAKILDAKGFQKILGKLAAVQPQTQTPATMTQRVDHRQAPVMSTQGRRVAPVAATSRPASLVSPSSGRAEPAQRILDSLGWWAAIGIHQPTRHQVAFAARYSVNGHFNNVLGNLRTDGLVDYPGGGRVALTDTGCAQAANPGATPTRDDLIDRVLAVLRDEPSRVIFSQVVEAGDEISREALAAKAGYTVNGHFNNVLGGLRSLGVIEYPRGGHVRLSEMFNF